VIWHDGQGACLFTKRLERGRRQTLPSSMKRATRSQVFAVTGDK
jgi:hypothetical protein